MWLLEKHSFDQTSKNPLRAIPFFSIAHSSKKKQEIIFFGDSEQKNQDRKLNPVFVFIQLLRSIYSNTSLAASIFLESFFVFFVQFETFSKRSNFQSFSCFIENFGLRRASSDWKVFLSWNKIIRIRIIIIRRCYSLGFCIFFWMTMNS